MRPGDGLRGQERLARRGVDAAGEGEPVGHAAGGQQDPRTEPAGALQHHHRGRGAGGGREARREVEDAAHVGAAEAVDRLVRVAHHREVAPVAGQRAEQGDLAGVGVLVLVHEHVLPARAELVAVGLGLDHGAADEVGVVGGAEVVEDGEVLLEEEAGRHQLREVVLDAEGTQPGRVETLLPGARQHGLDLPDEAPRAGRSTQLLGPDDRLGVVAEQLAQHHVGLGSRQQPDGSLVELGRGVLADERVGEGVERRARRRRGRAGDAGGDPVAQLLGGLAGERERQHRVGRGPALLDAVDDRLDQRRRLAGAGAGQHEERAALVVDHPLLVLVELRDDDLALGPHQAVAGGRGRSWAPPHHAGPTVSCRPRGGVWTNLSPGRRSRRPGRRPRGPGGRRRPRRRPPGRR